MIESVSVVCKSRLHQFVGRADHRRLVARLSACAFDPHFHYCNGYVTEVPRHQKLDAVAHGNSDRCSISRSFARYGPEIKKMLCKILGFRGGIQQRNAFDRFPA